MLGSHITKLTLFLGFLVTSLLYALLRFNKLVLFRSEDFVIWNDIWTNVTLTLATSLGFWFMTEGASSLFTKFNTKKIEREFLDEAIDRYNGYVHSLTGVHPSRPKKLPNYLETHTIKEVGEMVGKWQVMFAVHHSLNVENCFRPDGTYRVIKGIGKDIKRTRAEYAPYESQFSKGFNKKYHEMIRMMDFNISMDRKKDHEAAMSLLLAIREQLIQMENIWRGEHKKQEIKGKGRVFKVVIPNPPTRWKWPWKRKKVIRIKFHEDSK